MIKCFEHQTYPKDRIEWIIIDDGIDQIEDLVKHIPQVKYFYYGEKMLLGKKRNLMHSKCTGDIIIYMDDDDYYPPERISHAVETLVNNPDYLLAGSSEMHFYFDSRKAVYQCGPYKQYHSTAATFAFRKELLNHTIPLIQLDTLKSILVFSHKHNSLNKEKLLEHPEETKTIPSRFTVDDFIKDPILKQFYMVDMNILLDNYELGELKYKPNLLEQLKVVEAKNKAKRLKSHSNLPQQQINTDIETLRNEYEKKIADKNIIIDNLIKKVKELTAKLLI
jgi:glycosyltransferase involved in cell wall biosynthesis